MTQKLSKNSHKFMLLIGIATVVLFAHGCSKNEPPPLPVPAAPLPAKQPQKPVQKQVSTSLKLNVPPVNQFDFSTKKDPFKPYAIIKKVPILSAEKLRNNQRLALPIHSFDISQFKLIGVISGGKESQAMVTDPNGKGYVLKVGMTIGKNDGRIVSIANNGVEVLEQFKDDNGRVRKEHIKISMPRKQ
ncbi:MAG: pilus assembly protein PilP [Desulfuromonadales bacterium]|nr:pilus assembly protein PilP [Desulfuromonadales bacterium]